MPIEVIRVDYGNEQHAQSFRFLLNEYAKDPMGAGSPLPNELLDALPGKLAEMPTAFSIIILSDEQPAALANCFFGFSTFAGKKLVNVHDVVVLPQYRGQGLSRKLLDEVRAVAQEHGCCKLTLEVLNKNEPAMNAYRRYGFEQYDLDSDAGSAEFWQMKL